MTAHESTAASVLSRRALLLTVGAPKTPSHMVENLGCLYPIEMAQVKCILDRTIA